MEPSAVQQSVSQTLASLGLKAALDTARRGVHVQPQLAAMLVDVPTGTVLSHTEIDSRLGTLIEAPGIRRTIEPLSRSALTAALTLRPDKYEDAYGILKDVTVPAAADSETAAGEGSGDAAVGATAAAAAVSSAQRLVVQRGEGGATTAKTKPTKSTTTSTKKRKGGSDAGTAAAKKSK